MCGSMKNNFLIHTYYIYTYKQRLVPLFGNKSLTVVFAKESLVFSDLQPVYYMVQPIRVCKN